MWKNPTRGRIYDASGISPTLICSGDGGHEVKIYQRNCVFNTNGVSPTIISSDYKDPCKILTEKSKRA